MRVWLWHARGKQFVAWDKVAYQRICVILSGSEAPVLEGNCSAALQVQEKHAASSDESLEDQDALTRSLYCSDS